MNVPQSGFSDRERELISKLVQVMATNLKDFPFNSIFRDKDLDLVSIGDEFVTIMASIIGTQLKLCKREIELIYAVSLLWYVNGTLPLVDTIKSKESPVVVPNKILEKIAQN